MSHWCRQVDVTETFTTNLGVDDFHAALVADDTAVLHSLILAADTFKIADGSKNLRAEEAVAFRFKSTVVDGLGFLHLTE